MNDKQMNDLVKLGLVPGAECGSVALGGGPGSHGQVCYQRSHQCESRKTQ